MTLKKSILSLLLLLTCCGSILAETKEERYEKRHQIGVSIGDWMVETLMWTNSKHADYTGVGKPSTRFAEDHDYTYTPHFGLEYQYRLNEWVSFGMLVDFQHTRWNRVYYNNLNEEVDRTKENFFNLSFLPTVKFTYFHHKYVNVYSGLAFGMVMNGGSEVDYYGHHTAVGYAFNLNWVSVSADYDPWFAALEVGTLFGLKDVQTIYMAGTRFLSLTLGYRF